jgi:CRISPR system Cascade subunit CasE
MYLSRLILNPRNRRVQREIGAPYQMHRSLMRSFPDHLHRERDRVLFRVETDPRSGTLAALLQSTLPPQWEWLGGDNARGYLLPAPLLPPGIDRNPDTKSFALHVLPGQVLAFRLRANPTVKRRFDSGDHKRVGVYGEEKQIEWLKRKGEQGGFRVLSTRTSRQDEVRETIHRNGHRHRVKLLSVQFDGLLQVTDPERLQRSVRQGIGSGKGLGFGLLSLARGS